MILKFVEINQFELNLELNKDFFKVLS